jgi:hypothetical protein
MSCGFRLLLYFFILTFQFEYRTPMRDAIFFARSWRTDILLFYQTGQREKAGKCQRAI